MNARYWLFGKFPLLAEMFFALIQAFETSHFCKVFMKRNKIRHTYLKWDFFEEVFSFNYGVILLNKLRQIAFAHFEFFSA